MNCRRSIQKPIKADKTNVVDIHPPAHVACLWQHPNLIPLRLTGFIAVAGLSVRQPLHTASRLQVVSIKMEDLDLPVLLIWSMSPTGDRDLWIAELQLEQGCGTGTETQAVLTLVGPQGKLLDRPCRRRAGWFDRLPCLDSHRHHRFLGAAADPRTIPARNLYRYRHSCFGLAIFLIFIIIVGYFAKGLIGRWILGWGESAVARMPIVRSVYRGLKQIAEAVVNQSDRTFDKVCLIEYPRRGLWAIAFYSNDAQGEIRASTSSAGPVISVFLPTTPNPTSGFLLFVPERDVIYLEMSVEDAAKLVISAGLVYPAHEHIKQLETTAS